ncbi:MAG: putative zinc-binding metallopeptidase [Xanthobacteraceae bacterium]
MKLFQCQSCRQPLYFENTRCDSCGHELGYLPSHETVTALEPSRGVWRALAEPRGLYRLCANAQHGVCNWLVPAGHAETFCAACRHNRMIPDLSQPENIARWRRIEIAKRRLFYTLLKLRLPLATRNEEPDGLAFDFIADQAAPGGHLPFMTGHANGLITINLAEADDPERERRRSDMGEPYRTLLGHFRHEIAHYYWDRLVAGTPKLENFRTVFGDEREDYAAALQRHYSNGPPPDWPEHFVSAYASTHPWEDFAETWAHYFHMVDTLETANAFGLSVQPRLSKGADLAAKIDFDPHQGDFDRLIEAWLPLTFAFNSINRSMGLQDLYPFVLAPSAIVKLGFIHALIDRRGKPEPRGSAATTLRAIAASLKRSVGSNEQT